MTPPYPDEPGTGNATHARHADAGWPVLRYQLLHWCQPTIERNRVVTGLILVLVAQQGIEATALAHFISSN